MGDCDVKEFILEDVAEEVEVGKKEFCNKEASDKSKSIRDEDCEIDSRVELVEDEEDCLGGRPTTIYIFLKKE